MSALSVLSDDCLRVLEAAPVGIILADAGQPHHPVVFANRECGRLAGTAPATLIGRSLTVLEGTGRAELRVSDSAAPLPFSVRAVSDLAAPALWLGVLADVAAQRTAEHHNALMKAIPLPMVTLGLDGIILDANAAAEQVLGAAPGGLRGRRVEDFAGEGEINEGSFCHLIRRQQSVQRVEVPARLPGGAPLWLLASSQRFAADGSQRIILVFEDVTALKEKERRLTEANEEAERDIRARMRFLAAASHDLRQPLQAMALFASALDHHVTTQQGRTIVQSLKISLRGMEEMFDSLLDMSKLDAGVMKSEPQVFLISDIFEQLEMTHAPQAEAAGLTLRVVPSSAAVRSDPRLLARIIGNFLSNAIRYTRSGKVLLGVRRRGKRLRICVCDTGPGIPESQRLDIFREFRQGAPGMPGRSAGMGLGLAIVQRLARLLGHALDVRSTVGRGSTFAVEVPLMADDLLPVRADGSEDADAPDLSGGVVVVVDDDPDIQDALMLLLGEWGCDAVVAASAEEALAKLEQSGRLPEVILADLHLREHQSGIDAVARLRQGIGDAIPAFVFTGDTGAASAPAADQHELRILRKPLDPARLRVLLGEALGRV